MISLSGKIIAAASLLLLTNCNSNEQTTKNDTTALHEMHGDFVSLFDGTTLNGWHKYNGEAPGAAWEVKDGAIHLRTGKDDNGKPYPGGDLVTNDEYENFHLKLEWKISKDGNSGVIFMIQEDTAYQYPWLTGPEMQVIDNDGHPDAKINKHRAGDLYDLVACSTETVKPLGEWNLAEIIMNKGNLELKLNGSSVVNTTYGDSSWQNLVSQSKFKSMPDFGKFTKGHIGLQDHGNDVWYRNIEIMKL